MRISRIIAVIFVLWPTVTALAADPATPTAAQRFEGYVFLDTEEQPLPIQSDAEIEAFLAEAEIIETSSVPTGKTLPQKLTLKGEGFEAYACFKYADIKRRKVTEHIHGRNYFSLDWRDSYRYDIAAYELDRLLGLDRVPPTVSRAIKQDSGAVSIWLAKTVNAADLTRKLKVDPPDQKRWIQQRLIMQIFRQPRCKPGLQSGQHPHRFELASVVHRLQPVFWRHKDDLLSARGNQSMRAGPLAGPEETQRKRNQE